MLSVEYGKARLSTYTVSPNIDAGVVELVPSLTPFGMPTGLSAVEIPMRPTMDGTKV